MMTFGQRRLRNLALSGMVIGLLIALNQFYDMSLRYPAFLNGWVLFAAMALLAAFNLRKKISVLQLLPVAVWLQAHVYVGAICTLLFLIHTEFTLPTGGLETALWLLFMLLVGSGALGMFLSRTLPRRISARGERMLFERIPGFRADIARRAELLAMSSVQETRSTSIADFYVEELAPFMQQPRNLLGHLIGSNRAERRLLIQIRDLERYLDVRGREILEDIAALVTKKADLDHQYALQFTLRAWLFVHIPVSATVMLLTLVHMVLAYAFSAGTP